MVRSRRSFTIGEKLRLLRTVEEARQQGTSVREICDQLAINPRQYRDWRRDRTKLLSTKKKKRTTHRGSGGCLAHLEEDLVNWILEWREEGAELSYDDVVEKAGEMDADFASKTTSSKYHSVRRFCISNCLPIRNCTHTAQKSIHETELEAFAFIREMRPILSAPGTHPSYILNMDQTPLNGSPPIKRTLQLKGSRTVYSKCAGNKKSRFTCAVTVTADGKKLKPMLIFKGEVQGDIASREFPRSPYRDQCLLACQKSAWMQSEQVLIWINTILAPYVATCPEGITPILLLDDFTGHKTDAVKERLDELGVKTYWLPGGVTGLAQPIDVGVAKPFKDRYRRQFLQWKREMGIDRAILEKPDRQTQQGWTVASWAAIPQEVIVNSWRRTGFSYFPEDTERRVNA